MRHRIKEAIDLKNSLRDKLSFYDDYDDAIITPVWSKIP